VVRPHVEVIQELPQEIARWQREAPREVVVEDHRFPGLGRGHQFAAGGATAHKICGWKHPTLA
jgi:hypothetical protein